MSASLSVVMPVYNEAPHLPATVAALVEAASGSAFEVELVLVDDGSTDGSAEVVEHVLGGQLPLTVVRQPNRGRFAARGAGLDAATGDWLLLLDGRVRLDPESLAFVFERLAEGATVWNGHVRIDVDRNPFGAFWNVLTELAWREYFANPRTTSFDAETFDLYPKGTTCFLVPRALMVAALDHYRSGYADLRHANDDTPLIRWISACERVHLSPAFSCEYSPRATLLSFLRHSVHRGIVFLDGHGRRESRFFPVLVGFFPLSAALTVVSLRRPAVMAAVATAGVVLAASAAATSGRSRFEVVSFGALAPVYAVAHGLGMWRGLLMLARHRLAGAPR